MTASFAAVQASYRATEALSHRQTVTRLYRRSLRLLDSWTPHRGSFNEQALALRARFDANKRLDPAADAGAVARIVREAQAEAASWTHPDQYTLPYMPGGTKFMRNPPLPLSVCYPDGLPAGVEEIASKDVNGIQVRSRSGRPAATLAMLRQRAAQSPPCAQAGSVWAPAAPGSGRPYSLAARSVRRANSHACACACRYRLGRRGSGAADPLPPSLPSLPCAASFAPRSFR